jgi:hypothetical protein
MEQEILEKVIREMLGEQQLSNKKMEELSEHIERLNIQVFEFKSLLANIKFEVPTIDTFRIEGILYGQSEFVLKQVNEIKDFVTMKRKENKFHQKIYLWLIFLLVILLCATILMINCLFLT